MNSLFSILPLIKLAFAMGASVLLTSLGLFAETRQIITWDTTEISQLLSPDKDFAKAIFTVKNNGLHPVRILRATSESNAIKSILKSRILEPGESGQIEVIFLAEGKAAGLHHNKVQVFFEGHTAPLATLHFMVTIPKLIELTPNTLIWDETKRNQAFTVELKLDDRYINSLIGIEYDEALYRVLLAPHKSKPNQYQLTVQPLVAERPFNSTIQIKASGPTLSQVIEPIFLFNSYTLSQ